MPRVALYPGSFDPPTHGHLDIIFRASQIFDELVVAVGVNPSKNPLLTPEQRMEAISLCVEGRPNIRVTSFSGLLIDHVHAVGAQAIVRGLRATADFEYEFQMALVNRRLAKDLETVFLMTSSEYSYLSSSIVREVALLGGDFGDLVPDPVANVVRRSLSERSVP